MSEISNIDPLNQLTPDVTPPEIPADALAKLQFDAYVKREGITDPTDKDEKTFTDAWNLCSKYMFQVVEYALANKDQLTKEHLDSLESEDKGETA
jgi:hypothetical protein